VANSSVLLARLDNLATMGTAETADAGLEGMLTAARPGGEAAFGALLAPHRRALHLHCYRMLGSLDEAEEALQETLLRAWRSLHTYQERAPLHHWLHRIATTTCLKAIEGRTRLPATLSEVSHLQPYPDRLLDPAVLDPAVVVEQREDAVLRMPPEAVEILGRAAIIEFFATAPADGRLDRIRLVETAANGQPALAAYLPDETGLCRGYGVMVLTITSTGVAEITGFPDPDVFGWFNLDR
jgi:DNA-directed RNA polymerase specialized sigma24 family protein